MKVTRRTLLGSAAAAAGIPAAPRARAQTPSVKIGVLNDMSGPHRDLGGMTDVACVKQAVQEFGSRGFDVEVVFADHQNKPDVGSGFARQWFDRDNVDMIIDVKTSSVGLAVNQVCAEKNRAYLNIGAATTDLTGKQCMPVTVHWSYDNYMLAKSTGGAMVKAAGTTWYYAATLHYLKAIALLGPAQAKDGKAVIAKMKALPTDDDCFGKAHIREDGLLIVPSHLFEVKKPAESKGPWDYYKLLATTPADQAFEPSDPACPLNHHA